MNRRLIVAVALAVCVVLAGCGGSGQTDPGPETTEDDPPSTPTATPTPSPFETMPPGVSEEGVTNRTGLLDAHASALDGQSVTVDVDFQLQLDGEGQNASLSGKVTPDDDRGWMRVQTQNDVGTYYTEDGTTYRKVTVDGTTSYGTTSQVSAIPESPRFGADSRARDALWNANWTFDGVVERDGEHLLRYEATDVTLPSEVDVDRENATVTTGGTLLVDQDGVIRHVEVSATVETDQQTVEYGVTVSFSEIGTTSIDQPDWLDEANDG